MPQPYKEGPRTRSGRLSQAKPPAELVRHRIVSRDPGDATGVCAKCGPVAIKFQHRGSSGAGYYRCENSSRDWRNEQLQQLYGITRVDFDRMVVERLGRCDICQQEKQLHVDHDHETGAVRGLLCGNCNRGIGCLKENVDFLNNAIKYLEK